MRATCKEASTLGCCVSCLILATAWFQGGSRIEASAAADDPWREEVSAGFLPYHQLIGADFPINDVSHPGARMYTSAFFHYYYRYMCTSEADQTVAHITTWVVRSGFDRNGSSRKSWFIPLEIDLLHEQGHLDINEIYSRRFANTDLNRLPVGEGSSPNEAANDLARRLRILAEDVSRDAQTAQDAYDAQTLHGADEKKQNEAAALIQGELMGTRAADIAFERD
jgi:hypothetical protein